MILPATWYSCTRYYGQQYRPTNWYRYSYTKKVNLRRSSPRQARSNRLRDPRAPYKYLYGTLAFGLPFSSILVFLSNRVCHNIIFHVYYPWDASGQTLGVLVLGQKERLNVKTTATAATIYHIYHTGTQQCRVRRTLVCHRLALHSSQLYVRCLTTTCDALDDTYNTSTSICLEVRDHRARACTYSGVYTSRWYLVHNS